MAQNVRSVVGMIVVGIIAWIVAAVVAIAVDADSKVIWTCVVGALLGLVGIRYSLRRAKRGQL
ncbi:MAG: DUF2530 domain-containing protein [Actinobacteria bacterium]|nr:DUF2530 domain-containing protein [Actinomycetota bacterium]